MLGDDIRNLFHVHAGRFNSGGGVGRVSTIKTQQGRFDTPLQAEEGGSVPSRLPRAAPLPEPPFLTQHEHTTRRRAGLSRSLTLVDGLERAGEVTVLAAAVHLAPQRRCRPGAARRRRHLGAGRRAAERAPEAERPHRHVPSVGKGCPRSSLHFSQRFPSPSGGCQPAGAGCTLANESMGLCHSRGGLRRCSGLEHLSCENGLRELGSRRPHCGLPALQGELMNRGLIVCTV